MSSEYESQPQLESNQGLDGWLFRAGRGNPGQGEHGGLTLVHGVGHRICCVKLEEKPGP